MPTICPIDTVAKNPDGATVRTACRATKIKTLAWWIVLFVLVS